MPKYARLRLQKGDVAYHHGLIHTCSGRNYGRAILSVHYSQNREGQTEVDDDRVIRLKTQPPYYGGPDCLSCEAAVAKILSGQPLPGYDISEWGRLFHMARIGTLPVKYQKKLLADAGYEEMKFYVRRKKE